MQNCCKSLLLAAAWMLMGVSGTVWAQAAVPAGAQQDDNALVASLPDAPAPTDAELQNQPTPQSESQKTQREKAEEQMREQEHQRVLGIVPAFGTSYRQDAVALTGMQKIRLAFRSAVDPV